MKNLLAAAALFASVAAFGADVATVNGRAINDNQVREAVPGLNEAQKKNSLKDTNIKREALGALIDQELLVQEAEKSKLEADPQFVAAMAATRRRLLSDMLLQKNVGARLTEANVRKYYDSNKSNYTADLIHLQHILVGDENAAQDMLRRARAQGADFQKLAEESSKDPGAKFNRGDLGFLARGRWAPEIINAAFSAKDGSIIGPIRTSYGYHVVKVMARRPGRPLEYADVQARVAEDYRMELTRGFVDKLHSQAKIQIDTPTLEKVN